MNSDEFARLVAVYSLPTTWLANHIGGVSERTFRYWVSGRAGVAVRVPDDAVQKMRRLNAAIADAINT